MTAPPAGNGHSDDCSRSGAMIESNQWCCNAFIDQVPPMHDPFSWSIPLVRVFGINIRIHWLFPFVALGWILHVALYKPVPEYKIPEGIWIDAAILMAILFVCV